MQNNFFGSKLNTVLLLILIVLMIFAFVSWLFLDNKIFTFSFSNGVKIYESDGHENEADLSEVYWQEKDIMNFLKKLVHEYPNSQIKICSPDSNFYISLYKDTGIIDDILVYFDRYGSEVGRCESKLGSECSLIKDYQYCKIIYDTYYSSGKIYNIDNQNLKNK